MNENNIKKRRLWLIAVAILFIWAVSATITGISIHNKYKSLQSTIEVAGNSEFMEFIQQHGDTIISVHDDIIAIRSELESAIERGNELERRNERAYEYAKLTDAELADFGDTVASSGSALQAAISLQQRTIEFVRRIEENNRAIKMELGVRP